jgi:hypothetical protein
MGHVRDFLLKKMCDDFLELFKPLTKSTMTKNEFLIVFYNFLLESEIYMVDTENEEYFVYLCKYYINNSNLIDEEIFFMESLITEEPKNYLDLFYDIENLKDSYYGKLMLPLLEYTKENITIIG